MVVIISKPLKSAVVGIVPYLMTSVEGYDTGFGAGVQMNPLSLLTTGRDAYRNCKKAYRNYKNYKKDQRERERKKMEQLNNYHAENTYHAEKTYHAKKTYQCQPEATRDEQTDFNDWNNTSEAKGLQIQGRMEAQLYEAIDKVCACCVELQEDYHSMRPEVFAHQVEVLLTHPRRFKDWSKKLARKLSEYGLVVDTARYNGRFEKLNLLVNHLAKIREFQAKSAAGEQERLQRKRAEQESAYQIQKEQRQAKRRERKEERRLRELWRQIVGEAPEKEQIKSFMKKTGNKGVYFAVRKIVVAHLRNGRINKTAMWYNVQALVSGITKEYVNKVCSDVRDGRC